MFRKAGAHDMGGQAWVRLVCLALGRLKGDLGDYMEVRVGTFMEVRSGRLKGNRHNLKTQRI